MPPEPRSASEGRVFLTDANSRRTLAAVRSLGRSGLFVAAGHDRAHALAFASQYCRARVRYPDPERDPDAFADALLAHLRKERYDCFLPMSDAAMKAVVARRAEFAALTNLVTVDRQTLDLALDKRRTIEFALRHGIACPETFFVDDLESLDVLRHRVRYPAVIKPRVGSGAAGLVFVERPDELADRYRAVHRRFPFPLVQEGLSPVSPKYGVQCLFNRQGQLRAAVVQRFCRQYPFQGGPGCCFQTVHRPDVLRAGVGLLERLKWRGVAQVEFLEDERDGRLKLMEVNPRFWDSLQMAIQAGVDFPRLLYDVATRGDVPPRLEYRADEVCRSVLPGELLYLLTSWNRLDMGPSFWRLFGPAVGHCLWDRQDPRPCLAFFGIAARGLLDRPTRDAVFHRL